MVVDGESWKMRMKVGYFNTCELMVTSLLRGWFTSALFNTNIKLFLFITIKDNEPCLFRMYIYGIVVLFVFFLFLLTLYKVHNTILLCVFSAAISISWKPQCIDEALETCKISIKS